MPDWGSRRDNMQLLIDLNINRAWVQNITNRGELQGYGIYQFSYLLYQN